MDEYKASLDKLSLGITVGTTLLFLGLNSHSIYRVFYADDPAAILPMILTLVLTIVIFGGCYLLRPLKYVVTNDMVIVNRPIKDKQFHRSEITDAFLVNKDNLGWVIRTFGVGGLFGYFGSFRSAAFGPMTWYATRRSNYLVMETIDKKKILLTPDDTSMINEVRALIVKA